MHMILNLPILKLMLCRSKTDLNQSHQFCRAVKWPKCYCDMPLKRLVLMHEFRLKSKITKINSKFKPNLHVDVNGLCYLKVL